MAQEQTTPPYVSYLTFRNTIDAFAENTAPTSLDRHVLSNLSGSAYSQLIPGLRFLRLVGEGEKVEDSFRELVSARREGEDRYKQTLLPIIEAAYGEIVGKVDLQRGTRSELEEAFREAGVTKANVLDKCFRFYIKALKDCGVNVSPHITKPRPGGGAAKRSKKKEAKKVAAKQPPPEKMPEKTPEKPLPGKAGGTETQSTQPPDGFERLPIPGVKGGFIQYPENLTLADCTMYETMVGALRKLVEVQSEEGRAE